MCDAVASRTAAFQRMYPIAILATIKSACSIERDVWM